MGSLFSQKVPTPPSPPPTTVRDEISGVEQVPITNADGSITYVTRALPLTAQQQAQKSQLDGIMSDALAEIQKLSANDYADDPDTKRILDQWQQTQQKALDESLSTRSRGEEEQLARRGLSDSTAGADLRRRRLLDSQDAEQNLLNSRDELGNQVRQEKLGLQQNLYNIASTQTNAGVAQQAAAATRAQSLGLAASAQRQASLMDYYNKSVGAYNIGSVFGNSLANNAGRNAGNIGGGNGGVFNTIGTFLSLFAK